MTVTLKKTMAETSVLITLTPKTFKTTYFSISNGVTDQYNHLILFTIITILTDTIIITTIVTATIIYHSSSPPLLHESLTLSVPVVLLKSPNLSLYFSLNKFERIVISISRSLLCLINSHFLITKCLILYELCKEKLGVDN